jgi:hypothetical protein
MTEHLEQMDLPDVLEEPEPLAKSAQMKQRLGKPVTLVEPDLLGIPV